MWKRKGIPMNTRLSFKKENKSSVKDDWSEAKESKCLPDEFENGSYDGEFKY